MKIIVEDGIIVCSLEDPTPFRSVKSRFLRRAGVYFSGYYKGKLRISKRFGYDQSLMGDGRERDVLEIQWELRLINCVMLAAEEEGVEIDEAAHALFTARRALLREQIAERERAEYEARQARAPREKWESLCTNGCGRCAYRERVGHQVTNWCKAAAEYLKEKAVPAKNPYGKSYYNTYTAFPSEKCPYKTD